MKMIKICTNGVIEEIEAPAQSGDKLFEKVRKEIDGYAEDVYITRLPVKYMMIVNEEGKLNGLPVNPVASFLYGADKHNDFIVGDVIILKNGWVGDELDVVALNDKDVKEVEGYIRKYFKVEV